MEQKNSVPNKIAHLGIAVYHLDEVLPFYTEHLGLELEGIEEVESEQVKVAFLKIGESRIELLEPLNQTSSIAAFLEQSGEGVHHIAFEVEEIETRLAKLRRNGIQLIHEGPKIGANNSHIAFLHPKSTHGVLYELCEHKGSGTS